MKRTAVTALMLAMVWANPAAAQDDGGDKLIGNGAGESSVPVDTGGVSGPVVIQVAAYDEYEGRADTWLEGGEQDEEAVHVVVVHADGSETIVGTTTDLEDGVERADRLDVFETDLAPDDSVRLDHASTGGWDSLWVDASVAPQPAPIDETIVDAHEDAHEPVEVSSPAPDVEDDVVEVSSTVQTPAVVDEPVVLSEEPVTLEAEPVAVGDGEPMTELPHTGTTSTLILLASGGALLFAGWKLVKVGERS